jgi:diphosphomevalonate decarboxylase
MWSRGSDECADGSDSTARQLFDETHWPELRMLFLFTDEREKRVGSTDGMAASVRTSTLFAERLRCVPGRLAALERAIAARDFGAFAEIAMRESNQLHAVMLDTYPPLVYLTDASHAVIRVVHAMNSAVGRTIVGYTFDAGPNPVLFVLEPDVPLVFGIFCSMFPSLVAPVPGHAPPDVLLGTVKKVAGFETHPA